VIAVGSIITGVNGAITDMTTSFGPETIFSFQFNLGFRVTSLEEFKRKKYTRTGARAGGALPFGGPLIALLFSPNTFRPRGLSGSRD